MCKAFDPVATWIWYGLSDLYFGSINQKNDVYRYGTFFYIMAAEKHLKAVLIHANKASYDGLSSIESKKTAVEKIVKGYSHNFKKMIQEAGAIYEREMKTSFLPDEHLGFKSEDLIKAMYEGYMETRYPSVLSTSRHFPAGTAERIFHNPLGSSFFTEFIEVICKRCWSYLVAMNLDAAGILSDLEERFSESSGFEQFKTLYLAKLPCKL